MPIRAGPLRIRNVKEVMGKRAYRRAVGRVTRYRMMKTHSVKTSCRVFKVEVSVFADTVPSFFANRPLSTERI